MYFNLRTKLFHSSLVIFFLFS
jgi:N-acetylneuraminic acid mutarotase